METSCSGTVQATNISFMGLGFRHGMGEGALSTGQVVTLGMSGHKDVDATIRWSNGQCAGVQFSDCLDQVWESWVVKALTGSKAEVLSLN